MPRKSKSADNRTLLAKLMALANDAGATSAERDLARQRAEQLQASLIEEATASKTDGVWDEEVVRGWAPELTRCDHCGVLDDGTERIAIDEEFFWLHKECQLEFSPKWSLPVEFNNRLLGFIYLVPKPTRRWVGYRLRGSILRYVGEAPTQDAAMVLVARRAPVARRSGRFFTRV